MGEVWLDKTMSLDGFITGLDPGPGQVKELERLSVVETAGATHLRFRGGKERR